jgi:23S rRNA (adenine2503-C2)-methyltransferase
MSKLTPAKKELSSLVEMALVGRPVLSPDGSSKYLVQLSDGKLVEAVYLQEAASYGLCLSTQVGCNMGCGFCATARQRSERNLEVAEIVGQVDLMVASKKATTPFRYVTLAGMGEPLLNLNNSVEALELLREKHGLKEVSLSTIGFATGLRKLISERRTFRVYLSLHATDDETRRRLIPGAKTQRLEELVALVGEYGILNGAGRARISYLMLKGINDTEADLARFLKLVAGLPLTVQFLMWNQIDDASFDRVSDTIAQTWADQLIAGGTNAYVMPSFGRSVQAGCGQLSTNAKVGIYRAANNPLPLSFECSHIPVALPRKS